MKSGNLKNVGSDDPDTTTPHSCSLLGKTSVPETESGFSLLGIPKVKATKEMNDFEHLPRVVKFSGGRTSGLLLFILLENGMLNRDRGDVVVFNDTSAEHPETYKFVNRCKTLTETKYGVPFFWTQFQSYETKTRGRWTRGRSYRLTNGKPWSFDNLTGNFCKGETFEEMLSWGGYAPRAVLRMCTKMLKFDTTLMFLQDWFSGEDRLKFKGHEGESRITDEELYAHHLSFRGQQERTEYLRLKDFCRSMPTYRPEQKFSDYSPPAVPVTNEFVRGENLGEFNFVSFVGFRKDEQRRVSRLKDRKKSCSHVRMEGERSTVPLVEWGIGLTDVNEFWRQQSWGLQIPQELSNCTLCFMKGVGNLKKAHEFLESESPERNTPSDVDWWVRVERFYSQLSDHDSSQLDLFREGKKEPNMLGFFEVKTEFTYTKLKQLQTGEERIEDYEDQLLPCDCTD